MFMADLASQVLLVGEQQELNFEGALLDKLRNKSNLKSSRGQVVRISGEQVVNALSILQFDSKREVQRNVKGRFCFFRRRSHDGYSKKRWK